MQFMAAVATTPRGRVIAAEEDVRTALGTRSLEATVASAIGGALARSAYLPTGFAPAYAKEKLPHSGRPVNVELCWKMDKPRFDVKVLVWIATGRMQVRNLITRCWVESGTIAGVIELVLETCAAKSAAHRLTRSTGAA